MPPYNELLLHRPSDVLKGFERPMLSAPVLDVAPIETVALHRDDVTDVDHILRSSWSAVSCPSQLGDDGVFSRGDERRPIEDAHMQPPLEPRQVVRIVGELEEFDRECRAGGLYEVPRGAGDPLEPGLRVQPEWWRELLTQRLEGAREQLDDEIRVAGRSRHTVEIGGQRPNDHERNLDSLQRIEHRPDDIIARQRRPSTASIRSR